MEERKFRILLFTVIALCLVLTAVHFGWDVWAYRHCSIIRFIAGEIWP